MDITQELLIQVLYAAVINSVIVYGILKTIKKLLEHKTFPVWISVGLTYGMGFGISAAFKGLTYGVWVYLILSVLIGCLSVALYESIIKAVLGVVPKLINKISGE